MAESILGNHQEVSISEAPWRRWRIRRTIIFAGAVYVGTRARGRDHKHAGGVSGAVDFDAVVFGVGMKEQISSN
jgi:hypothetical protein